MARFLCVGDLHLEAGGDYCTHPGQRLDEQMQVWARALELAREHEADAVLFAGDAFHKAKPSPEAMLAFERPLIAHRSAAGCPIVAIPGNHDYSSAEGGLGLEVFAEAGLISLARSATVVEVAGVSLAMLPWGPAGRLVAAAGGGDRDELHHAAAETLLAIARGLRSQADGPCVLMTHFSISGAVTPDGADVGLFREPVLDAGELEAIGFDAVVAGHIHKPQPLFPPNEEGIFAIYTGSPMPLSFGEAKSDHGVWILDVTDSRQHAEFMTIESRRFVEIRLDYSADGVDELAAAGADVTDAIVKVKITATAENARRLDVGGLKRAILAAGAHKVWAVQTEILREDRVRVEGLDETLDELDALDRYLAANEINGSRGARLRDLCETYLQETRA